VLGPLQSTRHRIRTASNERFDRRRSERGQLGAPARQDLLRQTELLEKAAQCGGAEPGCERELKPARQPGILRHAGGEERESFSRGGTLGRLHHIQRIDGPRDVHDQRVGYPLEDAKHKRQASALVG
jgi:hypothetical protein